MIRLKQKVEIGDKDLMVSHRQKIENFNKKLANLPEHNDIPKVGPGWLLIIIKFHFIVLHFFLNTISSAYIFMSSLMAPLSAFC